MKLSLVVLQRLMMIGAVAMVGASWFVPWVLVDWISLSVSADTEGTTPSLATATKKKTLDKDANSLPAPTRDRIDIATSVRLHRMQPPKPAPVPEPAPAPTVPVNQTPLFEGSLIGIIKDSDPKYCFAVLKWPNSRIQLVAKDSHLSEEAESPTVSEVGDSSITLRLGERTLELELRAVP